MLDNNYCEWDMLEEDLNDTANIKLKYVTNVSPFIEDVFDEQELPVNNEPTRFHQYMEANPDTYNQTYEYVNPDEYLPMFAALKF